MMWPDRPIALLQGWGYTPAVWSALAAELEREVICPAMSGCADDLAARIPDGALVVGWSLGGMQALDLARRHPEKCAGLVLIATTPRFVAAPDWDHGLGAELVLGFRDAFAASPQRTLRRFVALQSLNDENRARVAAELDEALADPATNFDGLAAGLRTLCSWDLRASLPADVQCTLIHGRADAVVPLSAATWLARQFPGSVLHLFEDTGHAPHVSHTEAVAAIIREADDNL